MFDAFETETVETRWDPVNVHRTEDVAAIQRHDSPDGYRLPHQINHRANLQALRETGVETIFSVQSTGSLTESIPTGSFVIPHDFMNPWQVVHFHDDERAHGVAEFDEDLRKQIYQSANATDLDVTMTGVYVQTLGPRFETPAEANLLTDYGDVVGMTAGSEVTIACELDMDYVSLCSVDNYVNGIAGTSVSMDGFVDSVEENLPRVERLATTILSDVFNVTL